MQPRECCETARRRRELQSKQARRSRPSAIQARRTRTRTPQQHSLPQWNEHRRRKRREYLAELAKRFGRGHEVRSHPNNAGGNIGDSGSEVEPDIASRNRIRSQEHEEHTDDRKAAAAKEVRFGLPSRWRGCAARRGCADALAGKRLPRLETRFRRTHHATPAAAMTSASTTSENPCGFTERSFTYGVPYMRAIASASSSAGVPSKTSFPSLRPMMRSENSMA